MKITTKQITAQEMVDKGIKRIIWVNPNIAYHVAAFFIFVLIGAAFVALNIPRENYYANIP